jgi:hypothetical protein
MVVYDISQVWNTMYLKYRYQGWLNIREVK